MKSISYIQKNGLDKLVEEYGIKVKEYDNLLVLNYDQINSPKTPDVVRECRGLILDKNSLEVVCRPFDRFFNHGECPDTQEHLDMSKATVFDKVDGSLIKVYHYQDEWHIATRGTAYAESETAFGITFKELVLKALGCDWTEFQTRCMFYLDKGTTYLFEITSRENRVVKVYDGYTLHFLAARDNKTGSYMDYDTVLNVVSPIGASAIKRYKFDTVDHLLETVKSLKDLDEGYVVYQDGVPVCKIKSPAYTAVHLIRGEGLSQKRIMQLVLINEQDEYLTYFPEDKEYFTPYVDSFKKMLATISEVWDNIRSIEDQKEFALEAVRHKFSACLFQAKKSGKHPIECFHKQADSFKLKVFSGFIGG